MTVTSLINQFNGWFGIIGLIVGIVGIALSIKSKKERKPRYCIRSFNLVNDLVSKVESLKIFYSDAEIKNVTISKLIFWNDGRETIESSDITVIEPLLIEPKESVQILDAKIVHSKESSNGFTLKKVEGKQSFQLNFDYVDKGEGIIIQIIHTGTSSNDIKINGKIKGAGKPKFKLISRSPTKYPYLSVRQSQLFLSIIMGGMALAFLHLFLNSYITFFSTMMLGFLVILMIATTLLTYKVTIPQGFETYYDDF